MITPAWCHLMARYNVWQNNSLIKAASDLDDDARHLGRGAFFGSIQGTLSHLLWADTIWMARFDDSDRPKGGIAESADLWPDWAAYLGARRAMDRHILGWAGRLSSDDLDGELHWFSGGLNREVTKPLTLCVAHFFNHQTHHRGQVHAMLTAAGARPDDTDLFIMPEES